MWEANGSLVAWSVTALFFATSRSEQFFGSPSDTAAAAEGVRDRLLLVEERRLQLQGIGLHNEEEGVGLNGHEARLDVIGEELSEKEEQDEEEEEVERMVEQQEQRDEEVVMLEQQDEELERSTQDC